MGPSNFVAAIELGSSRARGIIGKKNSDGSIQIYAYASEDSSQFIRKGVIFNLDKTAQCITSIINQLEGMISEARISKVYVGISGKSLKTIKNVITKDLGEERKINQELLDTLNDENIQVPYVDMDILDVVPLEYKIGNSLLTEPVGILGSRIEGRFLNIVARAKLRNNLRKCFTQAKTEVADFFISPIVLGDEILSETEKRSGCALIDFGCDTTTVSVYKNNVLRFIAVLPLGGNNITKDISTVLKIEEDEAEKLKKMYGSAISESGKHSQQENPAETKTFKLESGRVCTVNELNDIIEARAKEIVANVFELIKQSQYDGNLGSGFIITGGASNLNGLEELMESMYHTGKRVYDKNMQIHKAKFQWNLLQSQYTDEIRRDGSDNVLLSMLCAGRENCCKQDNAAQEQRQEKPQPKLFDNEIIDAAEDQEQKNKNEKKKEAPIPEKPKKKGKMPKWVTDLFNSTMNDDPEK